MTTVNLKSWEDLLERVKNAPCEIPTDERRSRQKEMGFFHSKNLDEAMTLAQGTWKEGFEKASAFSAGLFNAISEKIVRHDAIYGIEGASIDVPRFLDNDPECWLSFEENIIEGSHGHGLIRVLFNCCASGGIGISALIAKGAAAAAMIELLEYSGRRVELTLGMKNGSGGGHDFRVRIKEFDQPLNMARVIFALAHPSTFRRFFFSLMETELSESERRQTGVPHGGYGTVTDYKKDGSFDLYINGSKYGDIDWTDEEYAKRFVLQKLEEQGIELKEVTA